MARKLSKMMPMLTHLILSLKLCLTINDRQNNATNVMGFLLSTFQDRFWRKTRRLNREEGSSCRGTDLNRNFDVGWQGKMTRIGTLTLAGKVK